MSQSKGAAIVKLMAVLVDGGYMDNTPIGPLRANGIRDIIVIDVGAIDDTSPRNYGDSVSGWWIFLNKCVRYMRLKASFNNQVQPLLRAQSPLHDRDLLSARIVGLFLLSAQIRNAHTVACRVSRPLRT